MSENTVFAIPCDHPVAKNGSFHCMPSYINSAHMRDSFDFIMLDTKKVIAHLRERNPELLEHANYKFRGETAEKWLKVTSPRHPCDMGEWRYEYGVLSMNAGQASMLKLVQELNLPCFPIAISKGYGELVLKDLRVFMGYRERDIYDFLDQASIERQQRAAAQEVLNALPREPGEPIPLATYDPDWEMKWETIKAQIDAENSKPYDDDTIERAEELNENLLQAFHAQFRTTGDYAQWMQDKVREALRWEGITDFKIPTFPADGSIEYTNKLYSILTDRIAKLKTIEMHQAPLEHPVRGQPFSNELEIGETRIVETLSSDYTIPTFNEIGDLSGREIRRSPYSYVCENRNEQINICFLQFGGDGPSPINHIEELASQVYNEKFGANTIASGGRYVFPGNVNFYIYLPPTPFIGEKLVRVDLMWENDKLKFYNPKWTHQESVPYVLRKLAAAEGLAKDPDAPILPKANPLGGMDDAPHV